MSSAENTVREHISQQIAEIDYLTSRDTADNLQAFRRLRAHAVGALEGLGCRGCDRHPDALVTRADASTYWKHDIPGCRL